MHVSRARKREIRHERKYLEVRMLGTECVFLGRESTVLKTGQVAALPRDFALYLIRQRRAWPTCERISRWRRKREAQVPVAHAPVKIMELLAMAKS